MASTLRQARIRALGFDVLSLAEDVRRLSGWVAARHAPSISDREDLEQAGWIGVLRARRTYRGRNGAPFRALAIKCAYFSMLAELNRWRWPRDWRERWDQVQVGDYALRLRNGRRQSSRPMTPIEVSICVGRMTWLASLRDGYVR